MDDIRIDMERRQLPKLRIRLPEPESDRVTTIVSWAIVAAMILVVIVELVLLANLKR